MNRSDNSAINKRLRALKAQLDGLQSPPAEKPVETPRISRGPSQKNAFLELERHLLDPEIRHSRAELEGLIHDDFKEFGTSGRVYTKGSIIFLMTQQDYAEINIRDFRVVNLSPTSVLVTYRTAGTTGDVRRSSIWIFDGTRWRIIFHQGTPLPVTHLEDR